MGTDWLWELGKGRSPSESEVSRVVTERLLVS